MSMLHKDSVRTAQKTISNLVIKTCLLMMFKAKVNVCSESHTKRISAV